ncbi:MULTISPECIES: alanine/glycine:cation symporter family protein [Cysteiniphilum]|uniref:alanine/glycine:cation symporter family protein n=1 Tax=Cysteiniphilum TaxID=2056696 RepID=UPI001786E062|nr:MULTISPECIES: sodium:alanine symporter family protein [Cysteiniphilum]
MEFIHNIVASINGYVWGPYMLVLILGVGLFLMLGLAFLPLRKLGFGFKLLFGRKRSDSKEKAGEISPFQALMTALSATIGTGNIAGVATAIAIGGPGAIFWMWCTALVGMATKYSEAVLAVNFREVDQKGAYVGGPMYYIKNGLGKRFVWLGILFAIFGSVAGFGIGNMVQINSMADVINQNLYIPSYITGTFVALLVALVLLGGIKRIAEVASKIVPFMAVVYFVSCLTAIILNISALPDAFALILNHAFNPIAATGGFAGAGVMLAIQMGVARGVFSNEAGLGSAPIAHAAAKTNSPVKQGTIAMLGTFIDTIVICTMTGLVIILSGQWSGGLNGASLSSEAMNTLMPNFGAWVITFGLILFAFTTVLGWSYYGERCVEFLFGVKAIIPFRIIWVIAIPIGAVLKLDFVWLLADTLNGLMALPNLIALLLLSPVVFKLSYAYFRKK